MTFDGEVVKMSTGFVGVMGCLYFIAFGILEAS